MRINHARGDGRLGARVVMAQRRASGHQRAGGTPESMTSPPIAEAQSPARPVPEPSSRTRLPLMCADSGISGSSSIFFNARAPSQTWKPVAAATWLGLTRMRSKGGGCKLSAISAYA
jgi:hypothetical protein